MASGDPIITKAYIQLIPSMEGSQATISKELGAQAEPAAKEAGEKSGKSFGDSLAKGLKTTTAVIAGAMAAATGAAVALGKSFVDNANSVAQYGDNVDKMSQKMGISAKGYQEWDFVMQHCGTSIDSLKSSMKTLATAAETNSYAFEQLGISQEQIANMSQEDLFNATIASLQNIGDETQRTYLAGKLLGRGATELGALLNMSAQETADMKSELSDLGGLMSDSAVKDAAHYQDSLQNMNTALNGVKNNMMSSFLPGMSKVMDGLSNVFSGNDGIESIKEGLGEITSKITELSPQFLEIASTVIMGVLQGFAPMLPTLVQSGFGFIISAITMITSMIPQMMPAIIAGIQGICGALFDALPVITQAIFELISSLVVWLSEGDNVKNLLDGIISLISLVCDQFAMILPVLLPAVVNIVGQVADSLTDPDNLGTILSAILTIVGAIVVALVKALPEIGGVIVKLTTNILTQLETWWNNLKSWFSSMFTNAKTKVTSFVSNIKDSITNGIMNVVNKAKTWGKDMLDNFISGIKSKLSAVGDAVKGVADKIKGIIGFSEPEDPESPLHRFHTFAPDMIDLFTKGIYDNSEQVKDALIDTFAMPDVKSQVTADGIDASLTGSTTNYNGGSISINVYGAEGQSANDIAEQVAYKLEQMTKRRGVVYA